MCDAWSFALLTSEEDCSAGCDSRLREKTINREKILESAAKHMTEQTHGGGRDGRRQRRHRRTEMIQVTHLLTWRERVSRQLHNRRRCERTAVDVQQTNSLRLDLLYSLLKLQLFSDLRRICNPFCFWHRAYMYQHAVWDYQFKAGEHVDLIEVSFLSHLSTERKHSWNFVICYLGLNPVIVFIMTSPLYYYYYFFFIKQLIN